MRCTALFVLFTVTFALLTGASASAARVVLYDGSVGDADPTSQGLSLTLAGGATATPDTVNGYVAISNPAGGDYRYNVAGSHSAALNEILADDKYEWTMKLQAKAGHDFGEMDFIAGSGASFGWRERFFLEADGNGRPNRFRMVGLSHTDPAHGQLKPGTAPGLVSMQDMNELRFVRNLNDVQMFINGQLAYTGTGGSTGIGSTQTNLADNSQLASEMNFAYFAVQDPIPEPASIALLLFGLAGYSLVTRRRAA